MNQHNSPTSDESPDLFTFETSSLKESIYDALENSDEFSTSQIVGIYYKVINVKSLVKSIEENTVDEKIISSIQNTEKIIDEKFNSTIHPKITSNLVKAIEDLREKLKEISKNNEKKTKEEIENQAKMFDKLRQIMSTKEFVDQYDKVLSK